MPTGPVIYAKIATSIDPRAPWHASMRSETWVAVVKANGYAAISLTPQSSRPAKARMQHHDAGYGERTGKQTAQTLGRDPLRELCAKPRSDGLRRRDASPHRQIDRA